MKKHQKGKKVYWYRSKRYGWGWDLPLTWQGWVVAIATVGSIFSAYLISPPEKNMPLFLFMTIGASIALVVICWVKGEPPGRR